MTLDRSHDKIEAARAVRGASCDFFSLLYLCVLRSQAIASRRRLMGISASRYVDTFIRRSARQGIRALSPRRPRFHRWLTPEQFADRFGLTSNDTSKIVTWLQSEGLRVHDVARGRHWITFSGSAAAMSRALRTEFHRYAFHGKSHFANTTDPEIPAALAGFVHRDLRDIGQGRSKIRPVRGGPVIAVAFSESRAADGSDLGKTRGKGNCGRGSWVRSGHGTWIAARQAPPR